jgi:hypothetical protein
MVGRFALLNLSRYYILFRSSPNGWRKNTSVFKQFYTSEGGALCLDPASSGLARGIFGAPITCSQSHDVMKYEAVQARLRKKRAFQKPSPGGRREGAGDKTPLRAGSHSSASCTLQERFFAAGLRGCR